MKLPQARTENIVEQDLDKELLIYDLINNKAYILNETSKAVFRACDGQTSFDELKQKYKFTDDLIHLALDELKRNDLIESEYISNFADLSRREAIRKVGLATMTALPIVLSITAPGAVAAASTCGRTCTATVPFGNTCGLPQGCAASNYLGYKASGCDNSCMYCECTVAIYQRSCTSTCRLTSQYQ